MQFSIQGLKWGIFECMGQKEVTILIEDLSILMVHTVHCLGVNSKLHVSELTYMWWQLVHPIQWPTRF